MFAGLSAVGRGVPNSSAEDSGLYSSCVGDPSSGQLIKFGKGSILSVEITRCEVEIWFSMDPIKNIKLRWLHGALHDITYELSRSQFSRFAAHAWEPAINAYRCKTCIRICVDLAGVDRSLIDLTVEPRRVVIRGARELPEPAHAEGHTVPLLAMEIDYGPFEREVTLPAEVEVDQAHAEQRNGLLWISLPLKEQ